MNNIPGFGYQIIGGQFQLVQTGTPTERLLIIGTSVDGPLNVPVQITDNTSASIFGPPIYSGSYIDPITSTASGNRNFASLPIAIAEAQAGGCTDIWAIRATGVQATGAVTGSQNFTAKWPGTIYNGVTIAFSVAASALVVTVTQPSNWGLPFANNGGVAGVKTYPTTYSVSNFIDDFNSSVNSLCVQINKNNWTAILNNLANTITTGTVTLAGGTNGLRARGSDFDPATGVMGYAAALVAQDTGTFDSIYNYGFQFNRVVLADLYIDDQVVTGGAANSTSIVGNFALWLDTMSTDFGPCDGVISVRPPKLSSLTELVTWTNTNLLATTPAAYDSNQKWICAGPFLANSGTSMFRNDNIEGKVYTGRYVQVVAGPEVTINNQTIGSYSNMPHVLYASYLTTVAPERAPIFNALPGVVSINNFFPTRLINSLVQGIGWSASNILSGQGAYVVLNRNSNGQIVIVKDCTMAPRADFFNQSQTLRVVESISNELSSQLQGFFGQPINEPMKAAMGTQIYTVLEGYNKSGALTGTQGIGYNYTVTQYPNDAQPGILRILLELNLANTLNKIVISCTVNRQ